MSVFIIYRNSGQYDDFRHEVVGYVKTEIDAKEQVKLLQTNLQYVYELMEELAQSSGYWDLDYKIDSEYNQVQHIEIHFEKLKEKLLDQNASISQHGVDAFYGYYEIKELE